ncbi:hypothetical protein BD289DRAFT_94624 [Coniella lustricola]|uniref:Transmembrane protein n=1 Tax=Coniella lustricola TaxID=2025994 RepID=A0A2T2ZY96_9PEZI|nr:hypothetical protein BD289DRAFT_94624 [Coniella lustricola]
MKAGQAAAVVAAAGLEKMGYGSFTFSGVVFCSFFLRTGFLHWGYASMSLFLFCLFLLLLLLLLLFT